jgi:hypothetical protein
MRLRYRTQFRKELRELQQPVVLAAQAAIKEAAGLVKKESAAVLSNAGLKRDRRAMRARIVPKRPDPTVSPHAEFFLRPAYLNVFQEGATVAGKPLLWVPLDSVPDGDRGRKLTPKQYTQRVGPLHSARGADTPMLVGKGTTKTITRATSKFVRFRKKAVTSGKLQGSANVPLYVGISAARIKKRMSLSAVVRRVASQVGELFQKHLRRVRGG